MNVKLAMSIIFTLLLLVACSQSEEPSTNQGEPTVSSVSTNQTINVPFTVDRDDFQAGVTVASLRDEVPVPPSNSGIVKVKDYISRGGMKQVLLLDSEGEAVAIDYLLRGVKEELTFDAENAVRAHVMLQSTFWRWSTENRIALYERIDAHPLFDKAVGIVKTEGRLPEMRNDPRLEIFITIAKEVAEKYLEEEGLKDPSSNNLETQRVEEDFGRSTDFWAGGLTLIQPNSNDHTRYSIKNRSGQAYRVFVYPYDAAVPDNPLNFRNDSDLFGTKSDFLDSGWGFPRTPASTLDLQLNISPDNCQLYKVVASPLVIGEPGGSEIITENPLLLNLLNLVSDALTFIDAPVDEIEWGEFELDLEQEDIDALHAIIDSWSPTSAFAQAMIDAAESNDYAQAAQELFLWLYEIREPIFILFDFDLQEFFEEGLDELGKPVLRESAEEIVEYVIPILEAAETYDAVVSIADFAEAFAATTNGEPDTAVVSTGVAQFEMEVNDTSLSGTVGEVLTGSFTVKNTGCRAMEYEASVKPSTFPTELGAPGGGTVEPGGEVEQNFQVTCERAGTGTANFHVVGYDAVAGLDHAAANPVVGVECNEPASQIAGLPKSISSTLVAEHNPDLFPGGMKQGTITFKNTGTEDLFYYAYRSSKPKWFGVASNDERGWVKPGETGKIPYKVVCPYSSYWKVTLAGTYSGTLEIGTNDPLNPAVTIDLKLDCTPPSPPAPIWGDGGSPLNDHLLLRWSYTVCREFGSPSIYKFKPYYYSVEVGIISRHSFYGRNYYVGPSKYSFGPPPVDDPGYRRFQGEATGMWGGYTSQCLGSVPE